MNKNQVILNLLHQADKTIHKKIIKDYFNPKLDKNLFRLKDLCIELTIEYLN